MKTIYKYPVNIAEHFQIEMPKNAEILCLQNQFGEPKIWVEVETSEPTEKRNFAVCGTGHKMADLPHKYIGTFQLSGGDFIGHLFEIVDIGKALAEGLARL